METRDPRNDSGVRSLDEARLPHNTPALAPRTDFNFYISGFVRNPGYYVLDPGMTIDQAIAIAGGLSERGSDRRLSVKRLVNGKLSEVPVKLEDKVQSNDTINIPSRFF